METHFFEQVFPILSPLAIDPAHPFPFIANGGFAMGLQLRREADDTVLEALLPVPAQVPRFVRLTDSAKGRPASCRSRRCSRSSSASSSPATPCSGTAPSGCCATATSRSRRKPSLIREFETALKRRRRGEVIQLTMTSEAPDDLRHTIVEALGVAADEVIEIPG